MIYFGARDDLRFMIEFQTAVVNLWKIESQAAEQIKPRVAPFGGAYLLIITQHPEINLSDPDKLHPSALWELPHGMRPCCRCHRERPSCRLLASAGLARYRAGGKGAARGCRQGEPEE